jgi:endoglucanase
MRSIKTVNRTPKNLPFLDEGIAKLESAGLAVSLDLHDRGQLKLDEPGHNNDGFVSFWQEMARHFAGKSENSIVFELVNEPQFRQNPEVWYDLQSKTVSAIRAIDPARTMMVSGTRFSGIDVLSKLQPLPESNLFYTVHSYDPFTFTHQGASWVKDPPQGIKSLTFPSSPENIQTALTHSTPADDSAIRTYGDRRYDGAYLKARLNKALEYGRANHVPIVLGEFGVYPKVTPEDARGRWFAAMGAAIADLGIANSLWAYDDAEGLGRKITSDGKIQLDRVTLHWLYGVTDGPGN